MNLPISHRWTRLWQQVSGVSSNPQPIYQELASLYSQPHRHYHNLQHIVECLAEFDSARPLTNQPIVVELAIWFHDAIYDTRAHDNEERSAELAKRWIANSGGTAELCEAVAALIMATKTHEPTTHPDAPLVVDVDLSILGQPQERFQRYETQIRREYEWVPEETFAAKRTEVLRRFLGRKRLYTTDHFFAKYEKQARANLQHSIRTLNKS
jgi:predicted metal-dependent HD superfamily phosphohydrolase